MNRDETLRIEWRTPKNKVEAFHRTLVAYKNIAQDVLHAGNTAEADVNLAWEILEDVMQGLISIFLDWFPEDEKAEQEQEAVTDDDIKELKRELIQVSEANMTNFVSINQALGKIDMLTDRVETLEKQFEALEREVSDQRKIINNLDFKNGEYDAQLNNLTDEENNLGIRLSLAEKKVRVLAQHCNVIFTE